jgi:type I restriction enzyme S subunit
MTTIENISNVGTGLTPLRSNKKFYDSGSIPWIKSTSLNKSIVNTAEEFLTEYAIEKTGIRIFPPNTLLIAMLGDGKTRGRVSELNIPATINQACAAIVINERFPTVRKYVKLFLQKQYDDIRKLSAGGVQSNLNLTLIKNIKIPLPPLSEQEIIVKYADKQISFINKIEFSINEQLMKLKILKKSILKNAFEGKLVSQDTNDEPAEILLEKIKREKESTNLISKEKSKIFKRKSIDIDSKQMRLM